MTHSPNLTYRRSIIFLAIACTLTAVLVLRPDVSGAAAAQGSSVRNTYSSDAGTRSYELYVPSTYKPGTRVPLIVVMHGCTQTAAKIRALTRFDQLAESKNMIVLYPEQSSQANFLSCWNWFTPANMKRGAGEPAVIAGMTQLVQDQYSIDPHRIYAAGLSAGGAMASVMSATYPDIFAASGIGSGCEYAATPTCAGWRSADPEQAGRQAYDAMGGKARQVPVIIFTGDKDTTVPPINAQQAATQWQTTNDWADDGKRNRSVSSWPTRVNFGRVSGGRSYRVTHYSDAGRRELIQSWVVSGMGHAWSGGCSCAQYADPAGPDETLAMYNFFMSHPAP
jgi:poly(hydroxyalkanoate) depolymerase family esterase